MIDQRWAVALLLAVLAACSSEVAESGGAGGTWVGTITTEGDVTTVVNESGSVWGGTARLVEEASIGVESGAEEYMFGQVRDLWVTDDRIYVLDSQVPTVRVYDYGGTHLMDVGGEGQGPGEFTVPGGLAVVPGGDILVIENTMQIDVFAPDGTPKDTWTSVSPGFVSAREMLHVGDDGSVWVPAMDMEAGSVLPARLGDDRKAGASTFPPDLDWEPRCLTYIRRGRESRLCDIPFQPSAPRTLMPDTGGWVLGISETYSFEVQKTDGTLLRVERFWEPVPVSAEEATHLKQHTTEFIRERIDTGSWSWNGPEIPDHKPAYLQLMPDRNGRIWVLREKASRYGTDCPEDEVECWTPQGYWLDAFGSDGRFLGSVTLERLPSRRPFIDGATIVTAIIDEAGTIMVKRYRLVLPGEENQ